MEVQFDGRYEVYRNMQNSYAKDRSTVRRRERLQEQQRREELQRRCRRKKEKERLHRKIIQLRILCSIVCVSALALVILLGKVVVDEQRQRQQDTISSLTVRDMDGQEESQVYDQDDGQMYGNVEGIAGESSNTVFSTLQITGAQKYPEQTPVKYSLEEIREELESLAQTDESFVSIYEHMDEYPEALLNNLCNNPNMVEFALSYNQKYGTTSGGIEDSELNGIPLFIQWDSRWGYAPYGNNVVGLSGCGPTCLSMVIVGLTKNTEATPAALADYAMEQGYYENGAGTRWSFMEDACYDYGVQSSWISKDEETVLQELEDGHPIICAMRVGNFTAEGHFIVLAGVENGKIRIHDPNSRERSEKLWDYEEIEDQISNLWLYSIESE